MQIPHFARSDTGNWPGGGFSREMTDFFKSPETALINNLNNYERYHAEKIPQEQPGFS
jgi:hypothetical protein